MQNTNTAKGIKLQDFSPSFAQRFWSKVNKNGQTQEHCPELGPCWQWNASLNSDGYGTIKTRNGARMIKAHRASWVLHYGDITDSMQILHRCDHRACVRPDHLFQGSIADNVQDKMNKGRAVNLRAEQHGSSKLNWESVLAIRTAYAQGNVSQCQLADQFGVARRTISHITCCDNWIIP